MLRIAIRQRVFVGSLIIGPKFSFLEITRIEFPVLLRNVDSFLQSFPLRFFGNVQKALHHLRAVIRK